MNERAFTGITGAVVRARRQAASAKERYDRVFTAAYHAYYGRLFAFTLGRTGDIELTKDIVACVFERAYARGDEVKEPAEYSAWLFAITKSLIMAHNRKVGREHHQVDPVPPLLRLVDSRPEAEAIFLQDKRVATLLQCVLGLTPRDQELISLKFDAGLSNFEIGEIMRITATNARVAVFRAMRRLWKALRADDATNGRGFPPPPGHPPLN